MVLIKVIEGKGGSSFFKKFLTNESGEEVWVDGDLAAEADEGDLPAESEGFCEGGADADARVGAGACSDGDELGAKEMGFKEQVGLHGKSF
jgi:hypothetical protein